MVFSKSAAVTGLLVSLTQAHMLMNTPKPYAAPLLHNGPLQADGSDFPCQSTGGGFSAGGASNVFPLGSTQPLRFTGQATHGGGSCQISITYDSQPTKQSTWKVIHSIEGGCPVQNQVGNMGGDAAALDPYDYSFPVPSNIPTGNVTLAWTWFNKVGNREMYMNCAPVQLTGTSGSQSNYDKLPDMFKANIGNGCGTVADTDLQFPNAGDSVERLNGATTAWSPPTGTCAAVAGGAGSGSGSGGAASSPTATPAATTAPAKSVPGGVFVTVPTAAPSAAPVASTSAAPAPSATTAPAAGSGTNSGSASGAASGSTSGSASAGAMTVGSACSQEGEWNCINGQSYQQCGSGLWSPVMPLAAGTKCTSGLSKTINILAANGRRRRFAVRFRG